MIEAIFAGMAGAWLVLYMLIFFGSLIWASNEDSFILGIVVFVIGWAIAEFAFSIPIFATILANPLMLIVYMIIYAAAGLLYATMWKMPTYINKNKSRIQSEYNYWKESQIRASRDKKDETADVSFESFLKSSSYSFSVKNHKDEVASWVLLWPAAVMWELSHKPFIWVWKQVYNKFGAILEDINRNAAHKILEEKNK
jgi:K+-sensing histidine kinase KdpD